MSGECTGSDEYRSVTTKGSEFIHTKVGQNNKHIMGGVEQTDMRSLVLVGKSGNGKSATGNSILGKKAFKSELSQNAITQRCQISSEYREDVEREYIVIDTPGLFDTEKPFAERALEMQKAVREFSPKPHAFLVIFRVDARFTQEESLTVDMLRIIYGEDFFGHAILVFTRGTEISDETFMKDLKENELIAELIKKCGDRVVRMENNPYTDPSKREKLMEGLLDKIEEVSNSGIKSYTSRHIDLVHKCLKEHIANRKPDATLHEEIDQLVKDIHRKTTWAGAVADKCVIL